MRHVGLRIDVDTHDGLRDGVPRLLEALSEFDIRASFFVAMGPDHSGRAIFNLLRPGFLRKMTRTRAASVYGWRTVLSGTLLPSRPIGSGRPDLLARIEASGHELGPHSWDHRLWQDNWTRMSTANRTAQLDRAFEAYRSVFGRWPKLSAAPAWMMTKDTLLYQERFELDYATDCRGSEPFLPVCDGAPLRTPQIPTTLPTLDEALGGTHATAGAYFAAMSEQIEAASWPSLTIHAELEGGPYLSEFRSWLGECRRRQITPISLGQLLSLRRAAGELPRAAVALGPIPDRHGEVLWQKSA